MQIDRRRFGGVLAGGALATLMPLATRGATASTLLEAGDGKLRLASGGETAVWAYGGQVPGPLLRVKLGESVRVRLENKLAQPTSLSWHGVRLPNAMDGVAGLTQAAVAPGAGFDYAFTPPDAGLYWYHPHVFPHSAEQIGRGLYGVLIVDEREPPQVDDDVLLVLDDWALDAKGVLGGDFSSLGLARSVGNIGSLVTVNSKPAPIALEARPGARLRLRVLNACAARIALVGFDGAIPTVIAIDGQPSEVFRSARDTVPVGPGSRFEVMLDVPSKEGQAAIVLRGLGARGLATPDAPLAHLTIKGAPLPAHPPVAKLPDNPLLPTRIPLERATKRDLVIAPTPDGDAHWAWSLGGAASDGVSGRPLLTVKRGGAVTFGFVNRSGQVQQMHVHGHVFRVLHDLDDGWDPYWRDSILVGPGKTKHVAFVADNPGKWAIESLTLDRQVTGLAGWFEVV